MYVRQAVAIVGEKYFFVLDEMFYGHEALTNVAPDTGIDQRDPPIREAFANAFDLLSEFRNDAIAVS